MAASRELFRKISSYVSESFLDDSSQVGVAVGNQAMVVSSPAGSPRLSARFNRSLRMSSRSGTKSPLMSRSPRMPRSPILNKSPATSLRSSSLREVRPSSLRLVKPLTPVESRDSAASEESQPEKSRSIITSFIVVYTMIFFNGCCFTAVVPSVPFYLQQLNAPASFLGWVVSFYSLGQIIGSPTAGWLTTKMTSKHLLTISSTLGLFSSAVYAVAPVYMFVLISRLLTGISAGMEFATELTFIAKNTTTKERTTYLASVTAVNVVGFIMGPALGSLLAMLNVDLYGLVIDKYTGPGWLLTLMFMVDLFMVRFLFQDHSDDDDEIDEGMLNEEEKAELLAEINQQKEQSYGATKNYEQQQQAEKEEESTKEKDEKDQDPPALSLVLSLILVQFTVMCGFSVLETITSPLAHEHFNWDVLDCNLLFTAGGFVSLIAYVVFVGASKWLQDRWLVTYALVLCLIGFTLAIDWAELPFMPGFIAAALPPYVHRFMAGYFVMNAGFMTGRPVTFALYSKLIASKYQGTYLGWMVAGGSTARTLGPFAAVSLYYKIKMTGVNLLALFGTTAAFHLACLVLVWCQWHKLLPIDSSSAAANVKNPKCDTTEETELPTVDEAG